ncbi:hypothetical protein KDA_31570 [Dictyobacter alpinus]|uniref:Uncharacterized protein n=1 Tax=Dictyobacter alpinus TaxID=2014873 RepID=A0A402B8D8_9CHLR|nr:hypothetical protein KDA_31570 [Dictyobacter alpinus]
MPYTILSPQREHFDSKKLYNYITHTSRSAYAKSIDLPFSLEHRAVIMGNT